MNFFPLLFNYYANVVLHVIVLRLVFFKYIMSLFMFFFCVCDVGKIVI